MRKLEVYYHLYIPNNDAAGFCHWWIDSVLQKMRDSGLASAARVNICVVMPMYASRASGVPISSSITKYNCTFVQSLIEYINSRYPWANIIDIRDSTDKNLYEGQTLDIMYRHCDADSYVLYFHSKGLYSVNFRISAWREVLEHFLIKEWKRCLELLEHNDLVTVKDSHIVNSGNVYWAKGEYIKSLDNPLNSDKYLPQHKSDMYPDAINFRYAFELWIASKNPSIGTIHEIKCNPYDDYWFIERV